MKYKTVISSLKLGHFANDASGIYSFGPGVLACATRDGGRSEAGHCFHLLFLLLLLFSCFSPSSGILRKLIFFLDLIFGITRRNIKKDNFFKFKFFFTKADFQLFFCFLRPTFGRGRLDQPKYLD